MDSDSTKELMFNEWQRCEQVNTMQRPSKHSGLASKINDTTTVDVCVTAMNVISTYM